MSKPIYVTEPFLPPLEDVYQHLEKIWTDKCLTNNGPLLQQFEADLESYLGVKNVTVFANATLGLVAALQALNLTGEVITTPYSFVATANSIVWTKLKPVFVDIDPHSFNIDPAAIERAITPHTSAIMPVHVYGRPCDVQQIRQIADQYKLKVIYDSAHAFGSRYADQALAAHGDLSVLSLHATKVMNTFEGGIVISKDAELRTHISRLRNFGYVNETTVEAVGINCKMNEFQAAVGLEQLKHIDHCIALRRVVHERYCEELSKIEGLYIPPLDFIKLEHNYPYFPILVDPEFGLSRDALYAALKQENIHTRRYFYPLISEFPMYEKYASAQPANLANAHSVSARVLCLPIYPNLSHSDQSKVIRVIAQCSTS